MSEIGPNQNSMELRKLMRKYKLDVAQVAILTNRSQSIVRRWRMLKTPRPIPDTMLEFLRLKLMTSRVASFE